jgi:hypothetical protein
MAYRKISDSYSIWEPDSAPRQLLPPDVEPDLSFEEEFKGSVDDRNRIYYEKSGRYLGIYKSIEEADEADPYEFARKFIPGGRLPWENQDQKGAA